jgi:hypothetical protein
MDGNKSPYYMCFLLYTYGFKVIVVMESVVGFQATMLKSLMITVAQDLWYALNSLLVFTTCILILYV